MRNRDGKKLDPDHTTYHALENKRWNTTIFHTELLMWVTKTVSVNNRIQSEMQCCDRRLTKNDYWTTATVVLNDETVNIYKLQQMVFGAKAFFKVQSKY